MAAVPPPDPASSSAESLFADFLAQREAGRAVDLDVLCAAHPKHADALRRAYAAWERAHLAEAPITITVDGAISVESMARGAAGESLLQRLSDQPQKNAHYR